MVEFHSTKVESKINSKKTTKSKKDALSNHKSKQIRKSLNSRSSVSKTLKLSQKREASYSYWQKKSGPTLVCLHGLLDSAAGWEDFAESSLNSVLAIDLPGFAKTSLPESASIESYGNFLAEIIENLPEIKNKKFILVGHSLGGAVVSALLQKPEILKNLSGVALIAPAGYGKTPSAELFSALNKQIKLPNKNKSNQNRISVLPLFPFTSQLILGSNRLVRFSYSNWITNGKAITPEIEARLKKSMDAKNKKITLKGLETAIRALAKKSRNNFQKNDFQETTAVLEKIPILIIWGEKDRLVSVEHAKQARKCFPNSKILRLKQIGHYPQAEAPNKVIEKINNFFGFKKNKLTKSSAT